MKRIQTGLGALEKTKQAMGLGLAGNGPDRSGKELERYPARRQSEDCARSSRQKDAARLVLRALADLTAQLCQVLFHLLDNLIMAHGRPRL